jgi:hypothetical protein
VTVSREVVRDRLASLWDWWAEGVHMRLQPYRERGKSSMKFNPPYALRVAEQIAPADLPRGSFPEPVRLTTLDAHLGDYARLTEAVLQATQFLDCFFTAALAPKSDWSGTRIENIRTRDASSTLESANLEHADFLGSVIVDVFREDAAIPSHFRGAIFASNEREVGRITAYRQNDERGEHSGEASGPRDGFAELPLDLPR